MRRYKITTRHLGRTIFERFEHKNATWMVWDSVANKGVGEFPTRDLARAHSDRLEHLSEPKAKRLNK